MAQQTTGQNCKTCPSYFKCPDCGFITCWCDESGENRDDYPADGRDYCFKCKEYKPEGAFTEITI